MARATEFLSKYSVYKFYFTSFCFSFHVMVLSFSLYSFPTYWTFFFVIDFFLNVNFENYWLKTFMEISIFIIVKVKQKWHQEQSHIWLLPKTYETNGLVCEAFFFFFLTVGWIRSPPRSIREVVLFERRAVIGQYRPAYSVLCMEAADWKGQICNASNHVAAVTGGSDCAAASVSIKLSNKRKKTGENFLCSSQAIKLILTR